MLIYELFQKEELSEHNKKTPMQALAIIREDTVNCMTSITGFLSAWINSATLLAFFLVLVYVSGLMGVIICLGLCALGGHVSSKQTPDDEFREKAKGIRHQK